MGHSSAAVAERHLDLFPRQKRFVLDPARFPGYVGGIGSGKSFAGSAKVITRLNQKQLGMVAAPTYPMLRDATARTLTEMMTALGIRFVHLKADNMITIPGSGHEILLRSLDNPDAIRGPNLNYAYVDEASLVTREGWNIVKGRVRVGHHPQVWATFTPKGRNWCWEEWERDSDPDHPLYRVRTDENPELPFGFGQSLGYTGRFAEQELGGEFVAFEGVVYPTFTRSQVQTVDCEGWGTVLGLDLGTRNPTAILTIRHAGDRIHIEQEFYQRGLGSEAIEEEAITRYHEARAEWVVVDPSAAGLIVTLTDKGLVVRKATNNVIEGISRVTSIMPDLTIDPSCVNTIAEAESYQYPEGQRIEGQSPVKMNDHAMDVLRYAVMELVGPQPSSWTDIDPERFNAFFGGL